MVKKFNQITNLKESYVAKSKKVELRDPAPADHYACGIKANLIVQSQYDGSSEELDEECDDADVIPTANNDMVEKKTFRCFGQNIDEDPKELKF